jgi:hypothetical protein
MAALIKQFTGTVLAGATKTFNHGMIGAPGIFFNSNGMLSVTSVGDTQISVVNSDLINPQNFNMIAWHVHSIIGGTDGQITTEAIV